MTMTDIELVCGLTTLLAKEEASASRIVGQIQTAMDALWTPFEGHKVSKAETVGKWRDFLRVAQSGRADLSAKARELWFRLECQVAHDLKRFE